MGGGNYARFWKYKSPIGMGVWRFLGCWGLDKVLRGRREALRGWGGIFEGVGESKWRKRLEGSVVGDEGAGLWRPALRHPMKLQSG